jgi:hypothetical protein
VALRDMLPQSLSEEKILEFSGESALTQNWLPFGSPPPLFLRFPGAGHSSCYGSTTSSNSVSVAQHML